MAVIKVLFNRAMLRSLPISIGLRYVRSKRASGFLSLISMFALVAMALGVFALIVVLSVMNGFDRELKEGILRVVPHGYLYSEAPMEDWRSEAGKLKGGEHLLAVAPFVEGEAMVTYAGDVRAVQLRGIDPEAEKQISVVGDYMLVGELSDLQAREYGIVLGVYIARFLGVNVGDRVNVTLFEMSRTPAGLFPRSRRFTVVGVFEAQSPVDQTLALINIEDAKKLFRRGRAVDGLNLRFDDIYIAASEMQNIAGTLGSGYRASDWSKTQGNLFQAVKMEKIVVGVMLSIIIAVAAFNIVTSLIMMVSEKRSNIAVLRTMGMTRPQIVGIFIVQGSMTGFIGIFIGAVIGVATAHYVPEIVNAIEVALGIKVFDPDVYFVASIPSLWMWQDTLWTCALAIVLAVLATLYPAYRASCIEPAEALRYDI